MSIKLMIGLVVGLLWLGSCGEDEKPSIAAVDLEAVDPQGQEVVFWYQHTREREEALLELIAEFNRTNPHGIQVRGEFAGGYGDIYNKMLVALQGGEHLSWWWRTRTRPWPIIRLAGSWT